MIWIIGNKGMLGRELSQLLEQSGVSYLGSDLEVSILDYSRLKEFSTNRRISVVINCSAYTAVDKAESDSEMAYHINADGVANIAQVAADMGALLIHISTDYVFDGNNSQPLNEESSTNPNGVYGRSKLAGENEIKRICQKYFIVRTSWLYGKFGQNFVFTMLKLMNSKSSIKVVNDQIGSPTWAKDLCEFIIAITNSGSRNFGIYHFSGDGQCSWYEFAQEIYQLGMESGIIKNKCETLPCFSDEYPTAAKRPKYSLLSKSKAKDVFGFDIPGWKASLNRFIYDIKDEYKGESLA